MSFSWKAFLEVAGDLISRQNVNKEFEEACFRSAISRSYYGVFGEAANYLKSKGFAIPLKDTHKSLREEFANSQVQAEKKVGVDLGRLWKGRKDADYDETADISLDVAKTHYQMAIKTLENIKSLNPIKIL